MGTDVKVRAHHQKFFDDLKKKAKAEEVVKPNLKEQAELALKVAGGNKSKAARLLGWRRAKLRWYLGEP